MTQYRLQFLDAHNEVCTLYFETWLEASEWIKPRQIYGDATMVSIREIKLNKEVY